MRTVDNSVNSRFKDWRGHRMIPQKLIWITASSGRQRHHAGMESRIEALRRQIAFYRRQLETGVDSKLAGEYLAQILKGEAELKAIADKGRVNE